MLGHHVVSERHPAPSGATAQAGGCEAGTIATSSQGPFTYGRRAEGKGGQHLGPEQTQQRETDRSSRRVSGRKTLRAVVFWKPCENRPSARSDERCRTRVRAGGQSPPSSRRASRQVPVGRLPVRGAQARR